jgi:hypothetical protein
VLVPVVLLVVVVLLVGVVGLVRQVLNSNHPRGKTAEFEKNIRALWCRRGTSL